MKRLLATIALTGSVLSLAGHAHADDPLDEPAFEAPASLDQVSIGGENAVQSVGNAGSSINELSKHNGEQRPVVEAEFLDEP